MTQDDAGKEGLQSWRERAGWFLHELETVILVVVLVGGIFLLLEGVLVRDPLYPGALSILLGLLMAGVSITRLVVRG